MHNQKIKIYQEITYYRTRRTLFFNEDSTQAIAADHYWK